MRKVLKSQELFHYFANKVQLEGRSGNISFHGDNLYSYGTVIARHMPDGSVALSTHSYSPTTRKHQSAASYAVNHRRVIRVPEIGSVNDVFSDARRQVEQLNLKALTATKLGDQYRAQARDILLNANRYAEALGDPERLEIEELTPEQQEAHKAAHRAALKVERERKAALEKGRAEKAAELLAKWLAGWPVNPWNLHGAAAQLRVKGDFVETTKGAAIPVADAIKLWPIILRCKAGDKCFTPGMPLGPYQLTKICGNGDIVVGCHQIEFSELEKIAAQLNLV